MLRFALCFGLLAPAACSGSGEPKGTTASPSEAAGTDAATTAPTPAIDAAIQNAAFDSDAAVAEVDAAQPPPPPEPPPPSPQGALHFAMVRDDQLVVARVVPGAGYVGAVGNALPVTVDELEAEAQLWGRDGDALIVDSGRQGVFSADGDGWQRLDHEISETDATRYLEVSPQLDRVLLGYRNLDPVLFSWTLSGALLSPNGSSIYEANEQLGSVSTKYGSFSADGTRVAFRIDQSQIGIFSSTDGQQQVLVPVPYDDVLAVFETSLLVGSANWPRWVDLEGAPLSILEMPTGQQLRAVTINGEPHAKLNGTLYRFADRDLVEIWPLPVGVGATTVLGYTDNSWLVGQLATTEDRAWVVLDASGAEIDRFDAQASVVEEDGSLVDVSWERRPAPRAWSIGAQGVAIVFEVTHTFWRGNYGTIAAITEELWVRSADGASTSYILEQYPPDEKEHAALHRDFTPEGRHYAWVVGEEVKAVATATGEAVELAEDF